MRDGTKIKAASKQITELLRFLEEDTGCTVTGADVKRWNGSIHGVTLDIRFCRGLKESWEDYGEVDHGAG